MKLGIIQCLGKVVLQIIGEGAQNTNYTETVLLGTIKHKVI